MPFQNTHTIFHLIEQKISYSVIRVLSGIKISWNTPRIILNFFICFAVFYYSQFSSTYWKDNLNDDIKLRWVNVVGPCRCFATQINILFCKLLWYQHWTKVQCLSTTRNLKFFLNSIWIIKSYRMNILMSLIKIHELNL